MDVTGTINAGMAKEEIAVLESGKKKSKVICKECGAKTSIDMKYCGICGVNLQEA